MYILFKSNLIYSDISFFWAEESSQNKVSYWFGWIVPLVFVSFYEIVFDFNCYPDKFILQNGIFLVLIKVILGTLKFWKLWLYVLVLSNIWKLKCFFVDIFGSDWNFFEVIVLIKQSLLHFNSVLEMFFVKRLAKH